MRQVAVFALLAARALSAQDFKTITGTYENCAYGYAVTLPAGVEGGPAESPDGGISVLVPRRPWWETSGGGDIHIFASRNAYGYKSAVEALKPDVPQHVADLALAKADKPMNVRTKDGTVQFAGTGRSERELGGMKAVQVGWYDNGRAEVLIKGLRREPGKEEWVYTIRMSAPLESYEDAMELLNKLVGSFRAVQCRP